MAKPKESGLTPLGDRIKKERNRMGFTSLQFAVQVGIPVSAVTGYENRGVKPSIDTLVALCEVLDCTSDWLLGLSKS